MPVISKEHEYELRILIATAEACHRAIKPSYSWHVFDWLCWKQRCKYPMVRKCDQIINWDAMI